MRVAAGSFVASCSPLSRPVWYRYFLSDTKELNDECRPCRAVYRYLHYVVNHFTCTWYVYRYELFPVPSTSRRAERTTKPDKMCCCCPPAIEALFCLWCKSGCSKSAVAGALTFFPPDPPLYKFHRISKDGVQLPEFEDDVIVDSDGDSSDDDSNDESVLDQSDLEYESGTPSDRAKYDDMKKKKKSADKKKKKSSSTADDSSTSTVDDIRESIQAIWPAFDLDGNGQVSACGKPSSYVYIPTYLIRADAFRSSHDRLTEKSFALLAGWQRACSPLPVVTSHRTKPRRPAADSSRRIITDDPRAVAIPAPGPAVPLAAAAIPVLGRSTRHMSQRPIR